ncbi:MAG: response regulator [Rhodanobacter sp.]
MSTDRTDSANPQHASRADEPAARKACVLLVEDDAIVAMLVEQILLDMDLQVLVVATLDNALIEAEMATFDAAVIDMYLRGDRAGELIDVLVRSSVPFMVLSGADQSTFHAAHPQITVLGKPFDKGELERCVRALLSR